MAERGVHCRGRGFNCPSCPSGSSCYDYNLPRPTLGLIPKHIWERVVLKERLYAISEAIKRCGDSNLVIPDEWTNEFNDIVRKLDASIGN